MAKNSKKGMSGKEMMAVGAGVAALSAGAYYLMGPDAKKHQKKAKDLMAKMKKEVVREAKKAKSVTVPLYNHAVDSVSEAYSKEYKAHAPEIKAFAKKLKSEWKATAEKTVKKVKSQAKKVVSKAKSGTKKRK